MEPVEPVDGVPLIRPPLRIDGERPPIRHRPPRLDEHGDDLRAWLNGVSPRLRHVRARQSRRGLDGAEAAAREPKGVLSPLGFSIGWTWVTISSPSRAWTRIDGGSRVRTMSSAAKSRRGLDVGRGAGDDAAAAERGVDDAVDVPGDDALDLR